MAKELLSTPPTISAIMKTRHSPAATSSFRRALEVQMTIWYLCSCWWKDTSHPPPLSLIGDNVVLNPLCWQPPPPSSGSPTVNVTNGQIKLWDKWKRSFQTHLSKCASWEFVCFGDVWKNGWCLNPPLVHARQSSGLCLRSSWPPPTCCHGCRTRWGWRSTLWGLSSSRWGWRRILWGLKSWSWNRKHHCHAATYTADFSASHQNLFRKVHSFSLSFFIVSLSLSSSSQNRLQEIRSLSDKGLVPSLTGCSNSTLVCVSAIGCLISGLR